MDAITTRVFRRPAAHVHGTLFVPAGARPAAAVLVIGGSGGSEPCYVAEALARQGMTAMSVAYFGRPGLPRQLRGIRLEYFAAALDILRDALPSSPAPPTAVIGMSRGSEAAMLTAIHAPDAVQGVVATVPGNVIAGSHPPGGPAWLLGGHPLPYAGHQGPDCENPDALIPVERVRGPVLLIAAGADQVWPSADMARALSARLRQHGDPHGHTLLDYPDAGHCLGYLIPQLPGQLLPPGLTDHPADQAARADAWPRAVEFLRRLPPPRQPGGTGQQTSAQAQGYPRHPATPPAHGGTRSSQLSKRQAPTRWPRQRSQRSVTTSPRRKRPYRRLCLYRRIVMAAHA